MPGLFLCPVRTQPVDELYQQRIATSDLAQALNLRQLLDVVHPMNPPRFSSFLNTHFPVGVLPGKTGDVKAHHPAIGRRATSPNQGATMKAVLLLATAAIALPFLISGLASDHRAVADRFLERAFPGPPTLPTNDAQRPEVVDADKLRAWVVQNPEAANAYAWRVMPLDFLFLAVLGGFLALAANILASDIAWPPALAKLPPWIWFVFPAAYVAADFVEDCLIVMLMSRPASISQGTFDMLTLFRNTKIVANGLAMVQIFVLGLAGVIWK
jgi:hypothetical protein